RVNEIAIWDDVKLLTVQVNRVTRWFRPGLLCIGDAAHAMSPVAGVGINLAMQDAVAAANILAAPLREGRVTLDDLQRVQKRRDWPTRVTQRIQLAIQNRVIPSVLTATTPLHPAREACAAPRPDRPVPSPPSHPRPPHRPRPPPRTRPPPDRQLTVNH